MIRAGKLTDLIFNGGNKKKPAKYCKVSLMFNNESKLIPIDNDEVRLTRVVKLSKTNEENYYSYFYVNGKPSSLTEFDNLLAHARISADGYNLVQQGDINRITQMSNLERRRILDDIAGITKFDSDISRAEDKREAVMANLERIQVLFDEIKTNLNQLKHDRDAALRYKQIRDECNLAKAQLVHKKKEQAELEISSLNEQMQKYEQERIDYGNKLEELKGQLIKTENDLEQIDNKIVEMGGEEAEEVKNKINDLKLTQYRATDAINTAREDIRDAKEEKSELKGILKTISKDLREFEKQQNEVNSKLEDSRKEEKILAEKLKSAEGLRDKSSTEIKGMQREVVKLTQEIDVKHETVRKNTLELDRMKSRIERLNEQVQENQEESNKVKFGIEDITWRIKENEKSNKESEGNLNELTNQFHQKKAHERNLTKQAQELEKKTTDLNREFTNLKARKDAAESVQKSYSQAVERVLDARDRGILRGIHGTIAELAEVDKELETALTVAAGRRMQSIVVDDDECATKAIEYIKKEKLGRATFLPLNKMLTSRPRAKALMCVRDQNSVGFAIDVVKFDEKYRPAFWYVFGDTVIMNDLQNARKHMGGVRMVTKDGELIEPSGAMVGGNIGKFNIKFGAPTESDLMKVSELLRVSIEESDRVSKELVAVREELTELEEKIREANMSTGSVTFQVDDLKTKKEELAKKLKEFADEYKSLVSDLDNEQNALTELESTLSKDNEELENLEAGLDEKRKLILKATPQKLAEEINGLTKSHNEMINICRDLEAETKTIVAQYTMYNDRKIEFKEKLEAIENRLVANNEKIAESKRIREELNDELNTLLKVEAAMDRELLDMNKTRDKLVETKHKLENTIENTNSRLESFGDLILSAKTKLLSVEDTIAEYEVEIQTFVDIKIEPPLPPLDTLKNSIQRLEVSMAKLEPVNMKAIEEYDIQAERKAKLENEFKRLEDEQKNLIKIVDNLKSKKKDGLLKVFSSVNENFQEIYHELSGGGTAELYFENEEEPFEGGLIIKARPKNKKVLRLEALSGGEKSLTALGLIFAIQHFQPSPFYLLDEVDMFLDAMNAEYVASMVKNNSETAQFIMISLRKVTLKKANHVYGVTIQNNGITDIVGKVNLADIGDSGEIKSVHTGEIKDLDRGGMYG
jgi:chromosome segregation protein